VYILPKRPHITKPTHTHTHTLQNKLKQPHYKLKQTQYTYKTNTIQVSLARMSKFHTVGKFEPGDTNFEIALWEIRSEMKLGHLWCDWSSLGRWWQFFGGTQYHFI